MQKIFEEAKQVILSRSGTYGKTEDSFAYIADLWQTYLTHAVVGRALNSKDAANMMILLKLAREQTQHKHDNYVDIIGYAAHADRLGGSGVCSKLANTGTRCDDEVERGWIIKDG